MISPEKMTVLNDRTDEFTYVWDRLNDSPVASDNLARATAVIGILGISQSHVAEITAQPAPTPELKPAAVVKCAECGNPVIPKVGRSGKAYTYCPKCKTNRMANGGIFEVRQ